MRGRDSTVNNSPSVGPDALIALVRLLARQAARDFVAQASATDSQKQQHYNLARSVQASRRFAAHLAGERNKLRSLSLKNEG